MTIIKDRSTFKNTSNAHFDDQRNWENGRLFQQKARIEQVHPTENRLNNEFHKSSGHCEDFGHRHFTSTTRSQRYPNGSVNNHTSVNPFQLSHYEPGKNLAVGSAPETTMISPGDVLSRSRDKTTSLNHAATRLQSQKGMNDKDHKITRATLQPNKSELKKKVNVAPINFHYSSFHDREDDDNTTISEVPELSATSTATSSNYNSSHFSSHLSDDTDENDYSEEMSRGHSDDGTAYSKHSDQTYALNESWSQMENSCDRKFKLKEWDSSLTISSPSSLTTKDSSLNKVSYALHKLKKEVVKNNNRKPPNTKIHIQRSNSSFATVTSEDTCIDRRPLLRRQSKSLLERDSTSCPSFQSHTINSNDDAYTISDSTMYGSREISANVSNCETNDGTYDYTCTSENTGTIGFNNLGASQSVESRENKYLSRSQSSHSSEVSKNSLKFKSESSDTDIGVDTCLIRNVPYIHGSFSAAAPLMLNNSKWMSILSVLMPKAHASLLNIYRSSGNRSSVTQSRNYRASQHSDKMSIDSNRIIKWAENNPVVAAYGMLHSHYEENVEQLCNADPDNITEKHFKRVERSHFANVRSLRRKKWKHFDSRSISSDTYFEAEQSAEKKSRKNCKPALEWDVFLDPTLVREVDKAMDDFETLNDRYRNENNTILYEDLMVANIEVDRQISRLLNRMMLAHGSTAQLLTEAVGVARRYNFSKVVEQGSSSRRVNVGENIKIGRNFFCCQTMTEIEYDDIFKEDGETLSSEHLFEPIIESSYHQNYNNSDSSNIITNTGGIFVDRWLALFASALKMGVGDDNSHGNNMIEKKVDMDRTRSFRSRFLRGLSSNSIDQNPEATLTSMNTFVEAEAKKNDILGPPTICGLFLCIGLDDPGSLRTDHAKSSMAESTTIIKQLLGESLRLILDLKSRNVPPRVWARLIDNLRSRGLEIDGLGSFDIEPLRPIGKLTSTPLTQIIFFHSAGDLQKACHANQVGINELL